MSTPDDAPPFLPRPWPVRPPGHSPLAGRRVLVVAGDLERARDLAARLTFQGCINRALRPQELEEALDGEGSWPVVIATGEVLSQGSSSRIPQLVLWLAGRASPPAEEAARAAALLPADPSDDELRLVLGRVFERIDLAAENRRLRSALSIRSSFGGILTRDPAFSRAIDTLRAVAETRATILLLGESGTGKTRMAQAVHSASDRSHGRFVVGNCGALPGALLESELFGHVKGAFTGALRDRAGRFEEADGGTIFLDEINSASLDLQVKLLRVIQEHRFERLGEGSTREVDVRVIAASNRDLLAEIEAGRFREDLYWRLKVVAVELPPLRERPGDVALLAEHFRERYSREYQRSVEGIDVEALALLTRHTWPGNVRELENAIERAVLLCRGSRLTPEDLPPELRGRGGGAEPGAGSLLQGLENLTRLPPLKEALAGPERQILMRALELTAGNRSQAAQMLGINRSTLFNKMRKYGLMEIPFQAAPPRR